MAVVIPEVNPQKVDFEYSSNEIIRLIMEICQNMVKIAMKDDGTLSVDEYGMDEDTPTIALKQKMLDSALTDVIDLIHKLGKSTFDGETFDGQYSSATSDKLIIPIKYVDTFNYATLVSMDKAIQDMIIYGSLIQWFTAVKAADPKAMTEAEYIKAKRMLVNSLKELYRKIVFKNISEYTLS